MSGWFINNDGQGIRIGEPSAATASWPNTLLRVAMVDTATKNERMGLGFDRFMQPKSMTRRLQNNTICDHTFEVGGQQRNPPQGTVKGENP